MVTTTDLVLAAGAATDAGRVRPLNEDSYVATAPVFVVADGMGGHAAGERASSAAVATLADLAGREVSPTEVYEAVARARTRVEAIEAPPGRDAGTTLSGVVVTWQGGEPYWLVVNVGDSRTYRLADDRLEQISVDHSEVQELVEAGDITEAEVAAHPLRHVVTRALGAGGWSEADFWLLPIGSHDRVLVCSDGLTAELDDDEIAELLRGEPHPVAAAQGLVRAAVARGGRDNVTAVVVDGGNAGADQGTAQRRPESGDEPDGDTKPTARRRP